MASQLPAEYDPLPQAAGIGRRRAAREPYDLTLSVAELAGLDRERARRATEAVLGGPDRAYLGRRGGGLRARDPAEPAPSAGPRSAQEPRGAPDERRRVPRAHRRARGRQPRGGGRAHAPLLAAPAAAAAGQRRRRPRPPLCCRARSTSSPCDATACGRRDAYPASSATAAAITGPLAGTGTPPTKTLGVPLMPRSAATWVAERDAVAVGRGARGHADRRSGDGSLHGRGARSPARPSAAGQGGASPASETTSRNASVSASAAPGISAAPSATSA